MRKTGASVALGAVLLALFMVVGPCAEETQPARKRTAGVPGPPLPPPPPKPRRARPSAEPGTEPGARTDNTAEPAEPSETPKAPVEKPAVVRKVSGVVVDGRTGRPIADARVLFAFGTGGELDGWHGDRTDAAGTFDAELDPADRADVTEVRVRKLGYGIVRRAAEAAPMRIELEPWDAPPLPGRVLGFLTDEETRPLKGRFIVERIDEFGEYESQWTVADAGGSFVLEGVPAGYARLGVDGGPRVEVIVPEGGETRAHVRRGSGPQELPELPPPQGLEGADLEKWRMEQELLRRAFAARAKEIAAQTRAPGITLRITKLEDPGGASIRLLPEGGGSAFWRARVAEGGVEFRDLPVGTYVLHFESPLGARAHRAITVDASENPTEIDGTTPAK